MAAELSLGKDQIAIHYHLEDTARAAYQFHLRAGKFPLDFGRQTGGPGLIVSDDTVLDADLHLPSSIVGRSAPEKSMGAPRRGNLLLPGHECLQISAVGTMFPPHT
jgi:hypothetical protein